jgi:hypothetical protein
VQIVAVSVHWVIKALSKLNLSRPPK